MTLPWPDRIDKSQADYSHTMGEETTKEVALGIQQLQLVLHGIINSKKQHIWEKEKQCLRGDMKLRSI